MSHMINGVQYAAPAAASTVALAASLEDIYAVCDPAGTLATLTITLPVASHTGQKVRIASSQIITTLTLNSAAGSISGGATTLAASGFAEYVWVATQNKWYRCG